MGGSSPAISLDLPPWECYTLPAFAVPQCTVHIWRIGEISTRDRTRINEAIRAREVRVIDADGTQLGVMPLRQALALAEERGLDLVEVAPDARPPVCRLMDYGKYLYERQKREREARKAQRQIEVKEVRLRPKTGEHDVQVVLRKARSFLEDGDKVKVRIRFRGREIQNIEVALDIMKRVARELADVGVVETKPSMEGRSMIMILAPASDNRRRR